MPAFGVPSPEQIHILLTRATREGMDASVTERLTVILHYAANRQSISETCRAFGISRSTFHRWMERFDPENPATLAGKSHEPLTVRQPQIADEAVEIIRRLRIRYPQMGKERIAELLLAEHGLHISASSVARVIERECLYFADTPLHWKKRMDHQRGQAPRVPDAAPASGLPVVSVTTQSLTLAPTPAAAPSAFYRGLRRLFFISSVVTNAAFIAMLLGMALYEIGGDAPRPLPAESQQNFHAAPSANFLP